MENQLVSACRVDQNDNKTYKKVELYIPQLKAIIGESAYVMCMVQRDNT